MPQATLTFTLPAERDEFETASRAGNMRSVLWDLDQQLRAWTKYDEPAEFKTPAQALDAARDLLYRLVEEHDCRFALE